MSVKIVGDMMKMIISDYDQTFYINDNDLEKNKIKVNSFRNDGNVFAFATGRSYLDFKNKVEKYNLEYDYVILNHGATIMNSKDEIIYNFSIDNKIIQNIKEDAKLEKCINHFCCSLYESRVDFNYKDLTKIHLKYNSKEQAMDVNEIMNKKYSEFINSFYVTGDAIEIVSNKTNKSYAIELLAEKLNISKKDIYTIGDGYSDIAMIKDYNGYCMEDSVNELLSYCQNKKVKSVSELINIIYFEDIYLELNKYSFFKNLEKYELISIQDYGRKSKFKIKTKNNLYTLIMTEFRIKPYIEKLNVLGDSFKKMIGFRYLSEDEKVLVLDYYGNDKGKDLLKIDSILSDEEINYYVEKFKNIIDSIHSNKFDYVDFNSDNKSFQQYYINEISEKIESIYKQKIIDKKIYNLLMQKLNLSSKLLSNRKTCLIHADATPLNVCINNEDKYLYLIDFDDVKIGDPLMDISRIINCKGMSKIFNKIVEKYYTSFEKDINHLFYTLRVNINWYNHIKEYKQENIYNLPEALNNVLKVVNDISNYEFNF